MQRRNHTAEPDRVRVEDDADGLFRLRLPLASTAEARDGRALDTDVVRGWREQIDAEPLPLFLDHGKSGLAEGRYGALGKVGYWTDPELVERDDAVDLEADAVVADPHELDEDIGEIREALAWLRTQAELGMPIATSAGWSEDVGDRDPPGGTDLMEGSIVGIPSDERTTSAAASDPVAVARAVEEASEGFDARAFLRELRDENGPVYERADPVRWPVDGAPGGFRHGRVVKAHEQYTPPRADEPITTPTDDEFVYQIQPFDRDESQLRETPVGKRGSELLPSRLAMPELDASTETDATNDMSDSNDPVDDAAGTDDDEQPSREGDKDKYDRLQERVDEIYEMNERELRMLREMSDYDDDDDRATVSDEIEAELSRQFSTDEVQEIMGIVGPIVDQHMEAAKEDISEALQDDGGEENADAPDEENGADDVDDETDEDRSVTIDGEEVSADEALDRLRDVASGDPEADDPDTANVGEDSGSDDEQRDDEPEQSDDDSPSFSFQ